ncbi:MAG: hypothetical protein AB8G05_01325 [Oligoflexales bacterium]
MNKVLIIYIFFAAIILKAAEKTVYDPKRPLHTQLLLDEDFYKPLLVGERLIQIKWIDQSDLSADPWVIKTEIVVTDAETQEVMKLTSSLEEIESYFKEIITDS